MPGPHSCLSESLDTTDPSRLGRAVSPRACKSLSGPNQPWTFKGCPRWEGCQAGCGNFSLSLHLISVKKSAENNVGKQTVCGPRRQSWPDIRARPWQTFCKGPRLREIKPPRIERIELRMTPLRTKRAGRLQNALRPRLLRERSQNSADWQVWP